MESPSEASAATVLEAAFLSLGESRLSQVPILGSLDPFEDMDEIKLNVIVIIAVSLEHLKKTTRK
jgi:hypothetical protein